MKDNSDSDLDDEDYSSAKENAVDNSGKTKNISAADKEQYNAGQLYSATVADKLDNPNWKESVITNDVKVGDDGIRRVFVSKDKKPKIVVPPSTDNPNQIGFDASGGNPNKSEAYSIEDALRHGKEAAGDKKDYTISAKIGQNRPMFKIFGFELGRKRDHWTHLEVKVENGKVTSATHTDSKGFLGRVYNLSKVKDAVKNVFGNDPKFNAKYTGRQGLLDGNNCGRFVAAHEESVINPKVKAQVEQNPLKYAKETMRLAAKCNQYNDKLAGHNNKYKADGFENILEEEPTGGGVIKPSITPKMHSKNNSKNISIV